MTLPAPKPLGKIKMEMIREALATDRGALPCNGRKRLSDCFTYERKMGTLILWFNDHRTKSTHIITRKVK